MVLIGPPPRPSRPRVRRYRDNSIGVSCIVFKLVGVINHPKISDEFENGRDRKIIAAAILDFRRDFHTNQ